MTTIEALRAAKARIDTPEKWTKGEYARGTDGEMAFIASPQAVCWCAIGAIRNRIGLHNERDIAQSCFNALEAAALALFPMRANSDVEKRPAASFNDHPDTTHADVMALFDEAIRLASESP